MSEAALRNRLETIARVARKNANKHFDGSNEDCLRVVLTFIAMSAERAIAQGIEARSAETPQAAPSEGRKPGPEGMRPNLAGGLS